jgi:hypothetical protein
MKIRMVALTATLLSLVSLAYASPASARPSGFYSAPVAQFTTAVAFDVSRPVRSLPVSPGANPFGIVRVMRDEEGPIARAISLNNDPVVQSFFGSDKLEPPELTFEGLKNLDNPFQVLPPDTNGDIGPHNYVETVNLVFAVYDRTGHRLSGPTQLGALWSGFPINDCTDLSGDPVVMHDRFADRWLIAQFTTRGPNYYNCVAVSKTSDPTGAYYRYAFNNGPVFPDYPKYGVWSDSYLLTTRDFPNAGGYGVSVYGLEKKKMIAGNPNAHNVHFFLDTTHGVPIYTVGDGLLPADVDGPTVPADGAPVPIIGDMNTLGPYGAPFDGLNIRELTVKWSTLHGTLSPVKALHVAAFNSTFPCGGGRACIPEPGTSATIDILSYRQRPTWRLAFRKQTGFDTMVTQRSVQARTGIAGLRWYEIRRTGTVYSIHQQGTYAPNDTVDRWMGSAAMDKFGNIAMGFSVSNATSVFPGIRYTGRNAHATLGMMNLGEAVLQKGAGSQTSGANRWGDYSSMSVDPVDDCTFWYTTEYYQTKSDAGWQTRIGNFKLPGCTGAASSRTFRK